MRDTTCEFTDAELETLDIRVRNLVTMCVCNGNPYEMASDHYGVPLGTVKSRINRARAKIAKLRAKLNPLPPDFSAATSPAA